MEEEKKIGFCRHELGEKVLGISYMTNMNMEGLRKKILGIISSKSEYKQILITGGFQDNHWNCILLTEFVPIDKIRATLHRLQLLDLIRVYFTWKKPGYWIMEGEKEVIDTIKRSPNVMDFK